MKSVLFRVLWIYSHQTLNHQALAIWRLAGSWVGVSSVAKDRDRPSRRWTVAVDRPRGAESPGRPECVSR